jgi:hypothetical protein
MVPASVLLAWLPLTLLIAIVTVPCALSYKYCRADLRECEYDCDDTCDCMEGLVCYRRDSGGYGKGNRRHPRRGLDWSGGRGYNVNRQWRTDRGGYNYYGGRRDSGIPGCPNVMIDNNHDDYCIDPDKFPIKQLWFVGSNRHPTFVYPLQECWGGCDSDEDWYAPTCT